MLDLLLCNEIDDRDIRLLLLIHNLQAELGNVRYKDLTEVLSIGRATVARRIANLIELGLLISTRTGSKTVFYEVPLLETKETPKSDNRQNQSSESKCPRLPDMRSHLDDTAQKPVRSHLDETSDPTVRSHLGEVSPHIIYISNYLEKKKHNKNCSYPERAMEPEMKISGPDGALKDLLHSSSENTAKAKQSKKEKRAAKVPIEDPDLSPERFSVPGCGEGPKTPHDFRLLFDRLWREHNLKGRPTRWTKKELAQVKDMISDQGAEVVIGYFRYVFENWESLQKRFRVLGYPSLPTMYGFRRTWMTEYQNGVSGEPKFKGMAEYNEAEAAKIPSGSWG